MTIFNRLISIIIKTIHKMTVFSLIILSLVQVFFVLSLTDKRVIIFGIDGFLSKCFVPDKYTGFSWLLNNGSYTFKARTSVYSISAPGWSNILCAQSSEETGITDNDWWAPWVNKQPYPVTPVTGNNTPLPCIFQTIKENNNNLKNAAIFTWDWLLNFGNEAIPNSIDKEFICKSTSVFEAITCDEKAYNNSIELIKSKDFDFLFIDLNSLDSAGHTYNFCSEEYVKVIGTLDKYLQGVISEMESSGILNSTYLIVTSDHGASNNTLYHGLDKDDDNLLVPWIMTGPNIKKGYLIEGNVKNADTSPTVIYSLGLNQNPFWRAYPVLEVFEEEQGKGFLNN